MEVFWKAVGLIVLTIILSAAIGQTEKDISIVLTVMACCIVMTTALHYFSAVIDFLRDLENSSAGQNSFFGVMLRISGVALATELTGLISSDAGNSSLGKAIQILGNAVILFLSLPIFEAFFEIINEIVEYL